MDISLVSAHDGYTSHEQICIDEVSRIFNYDPALSLEKMVIEITLVILLRSYKIVVITFTVFPSRNKEEGLVNNSSDRKLYLLVIVANNLAHIVSAHYLFVIDYYADTFLILYRCISELRLREFEGHSSAFFLPDYAVSSFLSTASCKFISSVGGTLCFLGKDQIIYVPSYRRIDRHSVVFIKYLGERLCVLLPYLEQKTVDVGHLWNYVIISSCEGCPDTVALPGSLRELSHGFIRK